MLSIFDIDIVAVSRTELIHRIHDLIVTKKKKLITYANVHVLNEAYADASLRFILKNSDLVINDSGGLSLVARLFKVQLPKHTITDLKNDFFELFSQNKYRVFFLGNTEMVMSQFIQTIQEDYPDLVICGYHHGFFTEKEEEFLLEQLKKSNPDIVLIGMGVPRQELWYDLHKENLPASTFIMGGNCFGYWSGNTKRAPQWMQKNYLEWLYRLIQEPIRLFNRYVWGNPIFFIRLLKWRPQKKEF